MVEIVRIDPVGHEPGMLIYECPRCKITETVVLKPKQPLKNSTAALD